MYLIIDESEVEISKESVALLATLDEQQTNAPIKVYELKAERKNGKWMKPKEDEFSIPGNKA